MSKTTFLPSVLKLHKDLMLCAAMNRRVEVGAAKTAAVG